MAKSRLPIGEVRSMEASRASTVDHGRSLRPMNRRKCSGELLLSIHARPVDQFIQPRCDYSTGSQKPQEVAQDCDRLLQTYAAHPFAQSRRKPLEIPGIQHRQPFRSFGNVEPAKEFSGNLALTANRGGGVTANFIEVSHEGSYVSICLTGRRRGNGSSIPPLSRRKRTSRRKAPTSDGYLC